MSQREGGVRKEVGAGEDVVGGEVMRYRSEVDKKWGE